MFGRLAGIAQLVEFLFCEQDVLGSSPSTGFREISSNAVANKTPEFPGNAGEPLDQQSLDICLV